jgi:hypothetical protein
VARVQRSHTGHSLAEVLRGPSSHNLAIAT